MSNSNNKIPVDDEKTIVLRAQNGEVDSFALLVSQHQEMIRACLAARMPDLHEAEDLAQDVFLTAFNKLGDFEADRSLGAWLRGIAMNLLRNHRRKSRPIASGDHDDLQLLVEQQLSVEPEVGTAHKTLEALRLCVGKLDMDSNRLLVWRYKDELSMSQLSKRLELKHSTLTMKLHRLRNLLRQCIEGRISKDSR
jgi:RNA polymerase sigma-70 factor (ECF subfamily)